MINNKRVLVVRLEPIFFTSSYDVMTDCTVYDNSTVYDISYIN